MIQYSVIPVSLFRLAGLEFQLGEGKALCNCNSIGETYKSMDIFERGIKAKNGATEDKASL